METQKAELVGTNSMRWMKVNRNSKRGGEGEICHEGISNEAFKKDRVVLKAKQDTSKEQN